MSIAELTEVPTSVPNPAHGVIDATKLAYLVASMEVVGWIGAPIVVDGDQALTGSHRIAAAVELWNTEGTEVPIPRIEVAELAAEHGIDWAELKTDNCDDWYRAAIELTDLLPADVVAELGMDLH